MDKKEYWRAWYEKLKENPEKYKAYLVKRKQYHKKYYERKKLLKEETKGVNMEEKKQEKQQSTQQEIQLTDWQKQILVNDIAWTKYELLRGVCAVNQEAFNKKLELAHQLGLDGEIISKLRSLELTKDW